jgi:hypothetical protein
MQKMKYGHKCVRFGFTCVGPVPHCALFGYVLQNTVLQLPLLFQGNLETRYPKRAVTSVDFSKEKLKSEKIVLLILYQK